MGAVCAFWLPGRFCFTVKKEKVETKKEEKKVNKKETKTKKEKK